MTLEEILGSKVREVDCYVASPFDGVPVIRLSKIVLEDGRSFFIEGEHDTPYIPISSKNMDKERIVAAVDRDDDEDYVRSLLEEIEEVFQD